MAVGRSFGVVLRKPRPPGEVAPVALRSPFVYVNAANLSCHVAESAHYRVLSFGTARHDVSTLKNVQNYRFHLLSPFREPVIYSEHAIQDVAILDTEHLR